MNTKEKILWEALNLFSQRGYHAVSVRDIAGAVGIRESSLYNHFSGKKEIFQGVVDICWRKAEEYYHSHGLPFSPQEDFTPFQQKGPQLESSLLEVFAYFFQDPWNTRFRRLLILSQFDDPQAALLYRRLYCQYPLEIQTAVFAGLMDRGIFRREDPRALAMEFYGGVFLLLHLCPAWEEAKPKLLEHIRLFQRAYCSPSA